MEKEQPAVSAVITKVERQKKNKHRFNIFLNEDYAFSVHEDMLVKHRLMKGEVIERERVVEIVRDDESHQAYLEAIRYIGRRPRSVKEVRLHLKSKGYEPEQTAVIVERLERERYLNDGAFAKLWTEHRILGQKKGRRFVEMELSQKGVADREISSALEGIDTEEERRAAWEAGRKKWNTASGELPDRKRKVMQFLLRRGYTHETVQSVVRKLAGNEPLEDWEDFMT